MKQNVSNFAVLLIGAGRLAKHLKHWNTLLPTPNHLLNWDQSQDFSILSQHLQRAKIVWLAISDSAIVPFYEKHLASIGIPCVHFSGALFHAKIKAAHPLMSFPSELLADAVYPQIGFALTSGETLSEVLPGFENSFFTISESEKPLYHALCVVAGNFPQILWAEVNPLLQQMKVPEKAFHLYLSQVLSNFLKFKENSLTGPIVRNDQITLEKNELALAGTKLKSIYQSFRKEFSL